MLGHTPETGGQSQPNGLDYRVEIDCGKGDWNSGRAHMIRQLGMRREILFVQPGFTPTSSREELRPVQDA